NYGGKPLLGFNPSLWRDEVGERGPGCSCSNCSAKRVYEFQILPTFLSLLDVDKHREIELKVEKSRESLCKQEDKVVVEEEKVIEDRGADGEWKLTGGKGERSKGAKKEKDSEEKEETLSSVTDPSHSKDPLLLFDSDAMEFHSVLIRTCEDVCVHEEEKSVKYGAYEEFAICVKENLLKKDEKIEKHANGCAYVPVHNDNDSRVDSSVSLTIIRKSAQNNVKRPYEDLPDVIDQLEPYLKPSAARSSIGGSVDHIEGFGITTDELV
ncbi:hypothetical protein ADUPG1_006232, partial [Aduncisulcus paluster]